MGLLDELKKTEILQGEELDNALIAIRNSYTSDDDRKLMKQYLAGELANIDEQLGSIKKEVQELTFKQQLGDLYEILPLAYIAKRYFKKSRGWLYQRMNGYEIHGKVCSFTEDEKAKLNQATREIAERIGSVQFV